MQVAWDALRELRALDVTHQQHAEFDAYNEVAGLLAGALLGGILWILLLRFLA